MNDYYQILGVPPDATPEQIKKAYRRRAHEYHPDRNRDDASAEGKFKEAAEAYSVLSSLDKRAKYDAMRGAPPGFSVSFGDIFGDIWSRRRRRRGANIEVGVEVTLDEVLRGASREVAVRASVACGQCRGTGAAAEQDRQCNCCGGHGKIDRPHALGRAVSECPACEGTGRQPGRGCPSCGGAGAVPASRTLKVAVPPGIADGQVVRIRGQGNAVGTRAGDLHVRVSVAAHPVFERRGSELWQTAAVPFTVAALGGKADVPTLDGMLSLAVPPGTQPGQVFRLAGHGLPRGAGRGDMLVRVTVRVPAELDAGLRDILGKLRDLGI